MQLSDCAFETDRLSVREWHSGALEDSADENLTGVVSELLSPAVLRDLPQEWSGQYTLERAASWIAERDKEGTTLLVTERSTSEPAGLVLLFAEGEPQDSGPTEMEIRIGYLFGEHFWGRGFASELVAGLVSWCRANGVRSIVGGVAEGNEASIRVLAKNGFRRVPDDEADSGEQLYRLDLTPGPAADGSGPNGSARP